MPGGVGHPAHQPVERIDLAHQMALAQAADGRVAGHLADRVAAVGEQKRPRAQARGGRGGLAAGMAAAHDDDIEIASFMDVCLGPAEAGRKPPCFT